MLLCKLHEIFRLKIPISQTSACTHVTFFIFSKPRNFSVVILHFAKVDKFFVLKTQFYARSAWNFCIDIFFLRRQRKFQSNASNRTALIIVYPKPTSIMHPFWRSFIWIYHKMRHVSATNFIMLGARVITIFSPRCTFAWMLPRANIRRVERANIYCLKIHILNKLARSLSNVPDETLFNSRSDLFRRHV